MPRGWSIEHCSLIDADSAFEQAVKAGYDDSVWCTWSLRWWDEQWIDPTVEQLRRRLGGGAHVAS